MVGRSGTRQGFAHPQRGDDFREDLTGGRGERGGILEDSVSSVPSCYPIPPKPKTSAVGGCDRRGSTDRRSSARMRSRRALLTGIVLVLRSFSRSLGSIRPATGARRAPATRGSRCVGSPGSPSTRGWRSGTREGFAHPRRGDDFRQDFSGGRGERSGVSFGGWTLFPPFPPVTSFHRSRIRQHSAGALGMALISAAPRRSIGSRRATPAGLVLVPRSLGLIRRRARFRGGKTGFVTPAPRDTVTSFVPHEVDPLPCRRAPRRAAR